MKYVVDCITRAGHGTKAGLWGATAGKKNPNIDTMPNDVNGLQDIQQRNQDRHLAATNNYIANAASIQSIMNSNKR